MERVREWLFKALLAFVALVLGVFIVLPSSAEREILSGFYNKHPVYCLLSLFAVLLALVTALWLEKSGKLNKKRA